MTSTTARIVAESRRAQGLPPKVVDPVALELAARLLSGGDRHDNSNNNQEAATERAA